MLRVLLATLVIMIHH